MKKEDEYSGRAVPTLESVIITATRLKLRFLTHHDDYRKLDNFSKTIVLRNVYTEALDEYMASIEAAISQEIAPNFADVLAALSSSIAEDRRRLVSYHGMSESIWDWQ